MRPLNRNPHPTQPMTLSKNYKPENAAQPDPSRPSRVALVVLGMHRSGTSALTRMLSLLGAALPENVMGTGYLGREGGNEAGHWEPERLVTLHDQMLEEAGSRWDDWRSFDPTAFGLDRLYHYKSEIIRTISEEYGDAPLFVLKDPRLCRFAPLYEEVLGEMDIEPRYILTHRNPVSVLDSLSRRDDMAGSYASLVWLRHVLDAEETTRGKTRNFLSYEGYLDDWRSAAEKISTDLGLEWPRNVEEVEHQIDAHLSSGLQHHAATLEDLDSDARVGPAVRDTYRALLALADGEGAYAALETLSRVKAEFESGQPIFADAMFEEMTVRQNREQRDREHLQRVASQNEAAKTELQAMHDKAKERNELLEAEKAQAEARNKALEKRSKALEADLIELRNSTSWRLTRPIRIAGRLAADPQGTISFLRSKISGARPVSTTPPQVSGPSPTPVRKAPLANLEQMSPEDLERVRAVFDADFYLRKYPDIAENGADPFVHYMQVGWKEGRDPSSDFSTNYYLHHSPDLAKAGFNPLAHWALHGMREKRPAIAFRRRLEMLDYAPKVSAIVPNYNHARFLEQRMDSILAQTYENVEILILDDSSTDGSRAVIERYCEEYPNRISAIFNEENSGSVFRQWRKGIESSTGELIWICESDDFCEPDFLEILINNFRDRSVNVAFGRIQFSDKNGNFQLGLDKYREDAEPGIWNAPLTRPARQWFAGGFGVNNVIANVGGCVFRRQSLSESVLREAENYSVLGDWFLYCHLAGGGQISYEPEAIAYFRQHGGNTSVTSFVTPGYYEEHERLMLRLRQQWDIPDETVDRFHRKLTWQYAHHGLEEKLGPLEDYCDKWKLLAEERARPHIVIAFLGFHLGGGETFPIHLANALHEQGHLISMLAFDMREINQGMLDSLDTDIPVYDSAWVQEYGADRWLSEAGVSIIHSHMVSLEAFFFEKCRIETDVPYLVTLHGSYEACEIGNDRLTDIASGVTHFVYTADKNLEPFHELPIPAKNFTKFDNAVPEDPRPFPKTREDLGIDEEAVVFTLVARGIKRKGWRAAVAALQRLREEDPERKVHLLLAGEGEEASRQAELHGDDLDITFLGYQSHVQGLFRLGDVAILPTRFAGESCPFCIIEALKTGTPVIATRVGEIPNLLDGPEGLAGILIEHHRDTELFIEGLKNAMSEVLDSSKRQQYARAAVVQGKTFSMDKVARDYAAFYKDLLTEKAPH